MLQKSSHTKPTPLRRLLKQETKCLVLIRFQYKVANAPGLDLVRADSIHDSLWCPSDQLTRAVEWYGDLSRYQWYLCQWDRDGYQICTPLEPQPDRAHINALLALWQEEGDEAEFTIPNDAELSEYDLCSISADGVAFGEDVFLAVYDSRLCIPVIRDGTGGPTRTDTARPLPAELDDYFSRLLS